MEFVVINNFDGVDIDWEYPCNNQAVLKLERVKNQGTGINVQAETTGCKTIDYSALAVKYINKNGFVRYWDDQAKAPYLFNGSTFISYEDKDSLEYKANYVIDKNIGGLMFWEYPLDNTHELVDTIYSVLAK